MKTCELCRHAYEGTVCKHCSVPLTTLYAMAPPLERARLVHNACLNVPNETLQRLHEAGGLKALLEHFDAQMRHPIADNGFECECQTCEAAYAFHRKLEGNSDD